MADTIWIQKKYLIRSNKMDKIRINELEGLALAETINKIAEWGLAREITTNGNPITQAIKTLEECHELLEAVNKEDLDEIVDAIGDIVVTLVMQCELQNINIADCISSAYNEIKDRKGHLNKVGDFIKEK